MLSSKYTSTFKSDHDRSTNFIPVTIRLRRGLKSTAVILLVFAFFSVTLHGTFENEFLRLSLITTTLAFTYYSYLHWIVRALAVIFNMLTVIFMESLYFRELLLQLACSDIGQCEGGNSFEQLKIL